MMSERKDFNLKEWTKDEYKKCLYDPVYFIKKYCWIRHPKRGEIKFALYPFQEKVLNQIIDHRYSMILKSRQLGISTLCAAYSLWLSIFHNGKSVLVVATKQDVAIGLIEKIRVMYKLLPVWLRKQHLTEENNKLSVRFANGSKVIATTSTGDAGRSHAASLVIIDEAAFIQSFTEKWASIQQTIATGGDCVVLSTPNGMGNWFHQTWTEALAGGDTPFFPIKLHWSVHPERDQKWRDEQDTELGARLAAQECDADFLTSGNTVIEPEILKYYAETHIKDPLEKRGIDGNYWIWEYYDYDRKYLVTADVARGDASDYSAFHVFDIDRLVQVAEYKGRISTKDYGRMLVNVASEYNDALLVIENANIGWATIQAVIDKEYKNLYYSHRQDMKVTELDTYISKGYDLKDKRDMVPGFTTSTKTRPLLISKMELYMREHAVEFYSQRLWDELSVFVWHNNGKPEASVGYNDDLVLAFSIAMWVRDTAIKLKQEGLELSRQTLHSIGSSISSGVYTSRNNKKHESWIQQHGNETIDLTEFL